MGAWDFSFIMEHIAENHVDYSPAGARSNVDAVNILKIVAEQFVDLQVTVLDIFAENNMVAARVLYEGTHTGECMGVPATGKHICFKAWEDFRILDGKP